MPVAETAGLKLLAAGGKHRSVDLLSFVRVTQVPVPFLPAAFFLTLLVSMDRGSFGPSPAALCFRKIKISFGSPKSLGADTVLFGSLRSNIHGCFDIDSRG